MVGVDSRTSDSSDSITSPCHSKTSEFDQRAESVASRVFAAMTNSPWAQPVFAQGADGTTDIKMEAILSKLLVADNEVIQKVRICGVMARACFVSTPSGLPSCAEGVLEDAARPCRSRRAWRPVLHA